MIHVWLMALYNAYISYRDLMKSTDKGTRPYPFCDLIEDVVDELATVEKPPENNLHTPIACPLPGNYSRACKSFKKKTRTMCACCNAFMHIDRPANGKWCWSDAHGHTHPITPKIKKNKVRGTN